MLKRLLSALSGGRRPSGHDQTVLRTGEAHAFFSRTVAPMPQVKAPSAANDAVMAPVFEAVERELMRAGYLR